jgi:hypothetical protein
MPRLAYREPPKTKNKYGACGAFFYARHQSHAGKQAYHRTPSIKTKP